jgi:hypothetical protein
MFAFHQIQRRMILIAAAAIPIAVGAQSPFTLDFEGINAIDGRRTADRVLEFYNGGASQAGTRGVNYGVSFSDGSFVVCTTQFAARCSNSAPPEVGNGFLAFEDRTNPVFSVTAGFSRSLSFLYALPFGDLPQGFTIWSGVNGTGDVLGTRILGLTTSASNDYGFVSNSVTFDGIARSVTFSSHKGDINYVLLDNIVFGIADASVVPEPATFLLTGFGIVLLCAYADQKRRGKVC